MVTTPKPNRTLLLLQACRLTREAEAAREAGDEAAVNRLWTSAMERIDRAGYLKEFEALFGALRQRVVH